MRTVRLNLFGAFSVIVILICGCESEAKRHEALLQAVISGDSSAVVEQIRKGAPIISLSAALYRASAAGHYEISLLLLEAGAIANVSDDDGWTPLMLASAKGDRRIIKALLEAGAELNAQDMNGETPLMWATRYGHVEIVNILLQAGADKNIQNSSGETVLEIANSEGQTDILQRLQENL